MRILRLGRETVPEVTDATKRARPLAAFVRRLRAKVSRARMRARAMAEADAAAERGRLIALCEAPGLLWRHDPERQFEPFEMIPETQAAARRCCSRNG